jgi:hypothetical protein
MCRCSSGVLSSLALYLPGRHLRNACADVHYCSLVVTRSLDMLGSEHTQPNVGFKLLIKVTMLSEGLMSGDVIGTSALARDRTLDPVLVSKAWATLCGHAM